MLVVCLMVLLIWSTVGQAQVQISWMSWGDQQVYERNERIIQTYYETFPERDVIIENLVVDWDSYRDRLPVWLAADAAADIISLEGSYMYPQIAYDNVLVDLTSLVIQYADEFAPGTVDALMMNGKIYGFPFHGWDTSPAIFVNYNIELFDEAGLPYPTYDWTWDDLIQMGQRLTRSTGSRTQWAIDFGRSGFIGHWQPLLYAYGGRMYAPDRSESWINSPEAAEAFEFLKRLDTEYGIQATPDLIVNKIGFITGQVAMTTNWHQSAVAMSDYVRFENGITILPRGPQGYGFHPSLTAHSVGINSRSPHVKEAWDFIHWMLTSPEALEAMGPQLPMVPLRSNIPYLVDMIWHSPSAQAGWLATEAVFQRMMPAAIDSVGEEYPQVIQIVTEALHHYFDSDDSIEMYLDSAKRQIDALLKELAR